MVFCNRCLFKWALEKLKRYDLLMIWPKTLHWARGDGKILVISCPPWSKEDHKVVK